MANLKFKVNPEGHKFNKREYKQAENCFKKKNYLRNFQSKCFFIPHRDLTLPTVNKTVWEREGTGRLPSSVVTCISVTTTC